MWVYATLLFFSNIMNYAYKKLSYAYGIHNWSNLKTIFEIYVTFYSRLTSVEVLCCYGAQNWESFPVYCDGCFSAPEVNFVDV